MTLQLIAHQCNNNTKIEEKCQEYFDNSKYKEKDIADSLKVLPVDSTIFICASNEYDDIGVHISRLSNDVYLLESVYIDTEALEADFYVSSPVYARGIRNLGAVLTSELNNYFNNN